ncbi:MAG: glycosyltransferase family 9 protein [Acidobacteriota bacterium]|nr:glycosyltransferase family 9 protein [Acidobacteriota bacterium]
MANSPARVLIVRLGAMGDILHALPAVALLRATLPEIKIGWVVERRWHELLCAPGAELRGERSVLRPLVDEVHLADTRQWRRNLLARETRAELLSLRRGMKAAHYQAALDLQGSVKSAVVARMAGTPGITGFRYPREAVATIFYQMSAPTQSAHVIRQNVELVRYWLRGIPCQTVSTFASGSAPLPRHAESEARMAEVLHTHGIEGPFAILNPGAGWRAKQWPAARYGELARRLETLGLRSVINYGPGEVAMMQEAMAVSAGAAVPIQSSISELIALTRKARLFVGGDTGPTHLAALLGIKTLALFGPTDPARNGPFWQDSLVLREEDSVTDYSHSRHLDYGLQAMSVEHVLEAAQTLLA